MNVRELVVEPRKRYLLHPHYHFILVSVMFLTALGMGIRNIVVSTHAHANVLIALGIAAFLWISSLVVHLRARKNAETLHSTFYGTMLRFLFLAFLVVFFLLAR